MSRYKQVMHLAANEAGKIIVKQYNHLKPSDIKLKSAHDIVTKVDMMANRKIKSIIRKNFPSHDILSEETGLEDNDSKKYYWTIDPLDGTTNFSINNPLFCTAISLSKGDQIVASIIYAPLLNELYYAEKGKGAYLNGRRIKVSNKQKLSEIVLLVDKTHNKSSRNKFFKLLDKFQYEVLNARWFGSASLEQAFLAAGRVGACIFAPPKLSRWDLNPGILLIKEAGGHVEDFKGGAEYYNTGLIAGNRQVVKKIQQKIKKWKF